MSKREIVDELSERAFTTQKQTQAILDGLVEIVCREAVHGFAIPGLCKFDITERKPRRGRNPQTGEAIEIPAGRTLRVRPFPKLKHSATVWLPALEEASASEPAAEEESSSFFIECPHCARRLEADTSMVGLVAECPYCENSMTVPEPLGQRSSAAPPEGGAEYVYFYCPTCQQAIEAPSRDAGGRMQCPTCKAMVFIPASTQMSPEMEELSRKQMLGNTIRIDIP